MRSSQLNSNLDIYLNHIDSIRDTCPMTLLLIKPYREKSLNDFDEFVSKNPGRVYEEKGEKKILIRIEHAKTYEGLQRNKIISNLASKIIVESLFVSLISQYDAFLSRLLRSIFELKPEILNGSERNLTFAQLYEIGTMEGARNFLVDKEIETVLRKSHSEQFDYLEVRLGLELRKNLPAWKSFVEITERRNLMVHTDGYVSAQYLKNCADNGCDMNEVKLGERLTISGEYFIAAYNCLYEIAVKLTHTIWRKLVPDELENADAELNKICYNLLSGKSFYLANVLLDFSCGQKRHSNDIAKNVFLINKSLCLYLQDKNEEAAKYVNAKDWTACSKDFKLAHAILSGQNEQAYSLMQKIGANGEVNRINYCEWPLFYKIRRETKFKETYREIFKEDYKILEPLKRPFEELLYKQRTDDITSKSMPAAKEQVRAKKKKIKEDTTNSHSSSSEAKPG